MVFFLVVNAFIKKETFTLSVSPTLNIITIRLNTINK